MALDVAPQFYSNKKALSEAFNQQKIEARLAELNAQQGTTVV